VLRSATDVVVVAFPLQKWQNAAGKPLLRPQGSASAHTRKVSEDAAKPLPKNVRVTLEHANIVLRYLEKYKVLVCSVHNYAVRNLAYHLREFHSTPAKERRAVIALFQQYELREASAIRLPHRLESRSMCSADRRKRGSVRSRNAKRLVSRHDPTALQQST